MPKRRRRSRRWSRRNGCHRPRHRCRSNRLIGYAWPTTHHVDGRRFARNRRAGCDKAAESKDGSGTGYAVRTRVASAHFPLLARSPDEQASHFKSHRDRATPSPALSGGLPSALFTRSFDRRLAARIADRKICDRGLVLLRGFEFLRLAFEGASDGFEEGFRCPCARRNGSLGSGIAPTPEHQASQSRQSAA